MVDENSNSDDKDVDRQDRDIRDQAYDIDKLQEYAAIIMGYLDEANSAAMVIQGHGQSLGDIEAGFEAIRSKLKPIEDVLHTAEALIASVKST